MSYIQELDTDIRITQKDIIKKINEIIQVINDHDMRIDHVKSDLHHHKYPDAWMDE